MFRRCVEGLLYPSLIAVALTLLAAAAVPALASGAPDTQGALAMATATPLAEPPGEAHFRGNDSDPFSAPPKR